jgi:hypothetical protein
MGLGCSRPTSLPFKEPATHTKGRMLKMARTKTTEALTTDKLPRNEVEKIDAMLDMVRREIRQRAGILDGLGGDSDLDRLIDCSIAPLVLVAASGGFESLDEAVDVVSEDLILAIRESSPK